MMTEPTKEDQEAAVAECREIFHRRKGRLPHSDEELLEWTKKIIRAWEKWMEPNRPDGLTKQ